MSDYIAERDVVALTLYGEARGVSQEGLIAVASVIANRRNDPRHRWGETFETVCRAARQFSCWNENDPNRKVLDATAKLLGPTYDPMVTQLSLRRCVWVADGVVTRSLRSTVGDATHYHALSIRAIPGWAVVSHLVAHIGGHAFYRDVP